MALIPRSQTYPSMLAYGGRSGRGSGGSSPRGSPRASRRSSWQRLAPPAAGDGGRWQALAGSHTFMAVLALLCLALLLVFVLYTKTSVLTHPSAIAHNSNTGAGGSPDAGAGTAGHHLPRLSVIGSRRLALERSAAATAQQLSAGARGQQAVQVAADQLWPDAGLAPRSGSAQTVGLPRVEYQESGRVVLLQDALNASHWGEPSLYQASPISHPSPGAASSQPGAPADGRASSSGPSATAGAGAKFPPSCPQAQAKRAALRRTWVQYAREHFPNVQLRFILAQPVDEREVASAVRLLKGEIATHADIIIVPGHELYRNLPNKTLQLLRYALTSACKFTHVMKTDDDVYIRPNLLMDVLATGRYNFSVPVQYEGSGAFDGRKPGFFQSPWMSGMYVGALDSNKSGIFPGWKPERRPDSKARWGPLRSAKALCAAPAVSSRAGPPRSTWYLSEADLPDELAPLGVRWASGWGYVLSRDLAEFITNTALMYTNLPDRRATKKSLKAGARCRLARAALAWAWVCGAAHKRARSAPPLPWRCEVLACNWRWYCAQAAWQECDHGTVLKHLDNDAPALQARRELRWQSRGLARPLGEGAAGRLDGLHAQQLNGLWSRKSIVCSSGLFEVNNYTQWRTWRNSLPDNQIGGFT
eukprot:scaffold4.g4734.t1